MDPTGLSPPLMCWLHWLHSLSLSQSVNSRSCYGCVFFHSSYIAVYSHRFPSKHTDLFRLSSGPLLFFSGSFILRSSRAALPLVRHPACLLYLMNSETEPRRLMCLPGKLQLTICHMSENCSKITGTTHLHTVHTLEIAQ